ncbi:hypothetical protein GCM10020258_57740 [Sphingomonas yabuuchiae]
MRIKRTLLGLAASVGVIGLAAPVAAQGIPVFDTTTYLQALQTARQTLTIVDQGRQQIQTAANQLQSLQKLTNMSEIASTLNLPQVRNLLPDANTDAATLLSGNLSRLGPLGNLASNIQARYRLSGTGSSDADAAYDLALRNATGPQRRPRHSAKTP